MNLQTPDTIRQAHGVPPGFRFHPTDEELIKFYLRQKVTLGDKFQLDHVIRELDLNRMEPWELREKCKVDASHQTEWYFFSHKDKKYPTGTRTNRATACGFWKATGRDKAVHSNCENLVIGMRKTLVFYRGRAPHGQKTEWIMHEYRLNIDEDGDAAPHSQTNNLTISNRATTNCNEDAWVVCRVFKKRNHQAQDRHSYFDSPHHLSLEDDEPEAKPAHKKRKRLLASAPSNTFLPCKPAELGDSHQLDSSCPTFLELPQLESPNNLFAIIGSSYNKNDQRHSPNEEGDLSSPGETQRRHCLQTQEIGLPREGKPLFASEDELADYLLGATGHGLPLYDGWNVYDVIARSNYSTETSSINCEVTPCLHWNRQTAPVDCAHCCEVDLWNFTK